MTRIFDVAYQLGEPSPTGPLSKRLLPYYYRSLFQSVTLDQKLNPSPSQLATLADYNRFTRRVHLVETVPPSKWNSRRTSSPAPEVPRYQHDSSRLPRADGNSISHRPCNLRWLSKFRSNDNLKHPTHISLNSPSEVNRNSDAFSRLPFVFSFLAKHPSLTSLTLTGWRSRTKGEDSTSIAKRLKRWRY